MIRRRGLQLLCQRFHTSCKKEYPRQKKHDSKSQEKTLFEFLPESIDTKRNVSPLLPFSQINDSETFGMLVRASAKDVLPSDKIKIINREDFYNETPDEESGPRFQQETLDGKFGNKQIELPAEIAKTIYNNIFKLYPRVNSLRKVAADMYIKLNETDLHSPPKNSLELDSHILTFFLQNYASCYEVLKELKAKLLLDGKQFNPHKVLDIGFGPATGMLALNELMGPNFSPEVRHSFIQASKKTKRIMEDRATLLLSRQLSEVNLLKLSPEQQLELTKDQKQISGETETLEPRTGSEEYIGKVDTKRLKINTKFIDEIKPSRKYDLIIMTHQLLKENYQFPFGIDDKLQEALSVLEPGGHLIIIERGNPLGFEIIARARQIMLRPENYSPYEFGKIPRPWIRGSSIKPQRKESLEPSSNESTEIPHNQILEEKEAANNNSLNELSKMYDIVDVSSDKFQSLSSDYYLTNISPYPHHLKCPFQMQNPKYYNYPKGSNLNWLNFSVDITRPKFSIDFKKGIILAGKWENSTDGIGMKGSVKGGSGRPNGKNYESANFNYLIMERSRKDFKTLKSIEDERKRINEVIDKISDAENNKNYELKNELIKAENDSHQLKSHEWARIIKSPLKRKGHVLLQVMTNDGNVEKWIVPKSFSKEIYHDVRKSSKGDWWVPTWYKTSEIFFSNDASTNKSNKGTQYEKFYNTFKNYEELDKKHTRLLKKELKKIDKEKKKLENFSYLTGGGDNVSISRERELESIKQQKLKQLRDLRVEVD